MNTFLTPWRRARELYAARTEPESVRPLAEIAWRTLLLLTCAAIVGIVFYAVTVFVSVMHNLESAPPNSAPPAALDRVKLDALMTAIAARGVAGSPSTTTPLVIPAAAPVDTHASPSAGESTAPAN